MVPFRRTCSSCLMSLDRFRLIGYAITKKDIAFDLSAESDWVTEATDIDVCCPFCEAKLDPIEENLMIN
jgi:hypothetical protein